MKIVLFLFLAVFMMPGHATLAWTQQNVIMNNTDVNQERDLLTLPVVTASFAFSRMITVCSSSQSPLPVTADDLVIAPVKIKKGETTIATLPGGSATKTPAKFTVTAAANPAAVTVYCSPLVMEESTGKWINGDDVRIQGEAAELTIHYSSSPRLYLAPATPTLDLGVCRTGGTLEKPLPLDVYYVGDNVSGGVNTTLTWVFTGDARNPDNSAPQVKQAGSVKTSAPVAFTQTRGDANLSLLFSCGTPGAYIWTLYLTATPL